ncbi:Vps54-domain-containing protein [Tilletiaria anomala UBC 951]|uniref:Vacuolar protein sorting-associated protein 54 n=1 Tax=Tilletiaria anomala (strain ATCC 24038 / CBS 436.72 / UBC 951) TaxID=1037660 RepID=A0A066WHI3_TILAU|nr:Vps54-domain-containing protein [Tilletiaria anomala UBC 951]KDN53271.1 Vps54-domain-containing protein [Tilletiaria anomala UBC 951]
MLRASEYGSPTDSVGSPKRGQASAASRSGRPIHRVAGGATAADAEMAGVHDSDDAITETGSVSGSTVQGSIIDSRLGSATGRGRLLSFDGIALADLTNAPGVALTGFNAISTVLNHPTKRSNPIDPKSSRYPLLPISYSELPTARKSDHAAYLEQIRSEWDRFVRSQRLGARGKARLGDGDDLASEDGHQERAQDPMLDAPESSAAGTSRFSIDVASLRSEAQSPTRLTSRKRLPSLESVPKVYFQDGFSLSSPNVFGSVVEHSTASEKSNANARNEDGDAVTYEPGLNQILQEKLSYYSDVIEQHLIVEIGARSSSFFAALGNLQDLSAEATSCLKKVNILKEQLVAVDDRLAKKGLQLIAKQARRRELQRTSKAVQAVQELIERRSMVTLLVSHGEYEEALDLMESIRMLLRKRTSQANDHALETSDTDDIDFSKVPAVASIISGFANHHDHIASALQQDLLHILSKELTERVMPAEPVSQDVNMRDPKALRAHKSKSINLSLSIAAGKLSAKRSWGLCEENNETSEEIAKVLPRPPAPLNEIDELLRKRISSLSDELLRKRISSLIFGLVRTKGVERALAAYRDVAFSAIREAVKGHLVTAHAQLYSLLTRDEALTEEMLDADDAARRLRDMPHMDFLEMGHTFFQALLDYLGGINAQTRVILSLLHDMAHEGEQEPNSPSGTSTPNGDAKMGQYDMPEGVSHALPSAARELLHSAGELSHACVSRFISIRAKQHTSLTLRDFLAVFQLCWSFVLCSELICRRMIMGLRGTVLNQAKSFLVSFHHMRVAAAAKAVEEEKWDQVDVDAALQVEIERIVNSATEDQPEFIVSTEEDEDAVIISGLPSTDSSDKQQTNGSSSKEPHAEANGTVAGFKTLRIENRDFCVVKASLDMLSQLGEYIRVIVNLPLLTTEAMTRVVEFLKQFNSRTCQVVLGAGAMRSAGLKNITAKHLALASQSLSVVIALIPYIRETVRRHLTARQAVMLTEFDKLKRDYQEHQYEIHAKLVAIMSDRLSVHCKALRGINWNAEASGAEPKVNKYMLDLVKETSLLYKVLYRYLPTQTIDGVMSQVLAAIDKRTAAAFLSLEIRNEGARARMVFDIEHLNSKMGSLKSLTWSGLVSHRSNVASYVRGLI